MKTKIFIILCLVSFGLGSISTARADGDNGIYVVGDVVLARPGCFLATIAGSVLFVVALPFAATSGSIHKTADTLIVEPAQATFTRPLGDFTTLQ
jgi:hypothetical protein